MERTDTCITVGLRPDYSPYDLAFPDLSDGQSPIRPPTTPFSVATSGRSADAPSDYPHFLTWFAHRVGLLPARRGVLPGHLAQPYQHASIAALDLYIRTRLFGAAFNPADSRWRALLEPDALARLTRRFDDDGQDEPDTARRLSTVPTLQLPRAYALPVDKCIYTHVGLAPADEGRDRLLVAWAQADPGVRAFCRVSPQHAFVRLPCADDGGADVVPDFLVRMAAATYLVDIHPRRGRTDARRRRQAAVAWCTRANALPPAQRDGSRWFYAPVHGQDLMQWRCRTPYLGDMLAAAQWQAHYRARRCD